MNIRRNLNALAIFAAVALFLGGCTYLQIRIILDCGWFALLKGSELLWLFGACHH